MNCRLCFDTFNDELFSPCLCNGSNKYIHRSCLEKWRMSNYNENTAHQCPTCKYEYRIEQSHTKRCSNYLKLGLHLATSLTLIICILFASLELTTVSIMVMFRDEFHDFDHRPTVRIFSIFTCIIIFTVYINTVYFYHFYVVGQNYVIFKIIGFGSFLMTMLTCMFPVFIIASMIIIGYYATLYVDDQIKRVICEERVKDINEL